MNAESATVSSKIKAIPGTRVYINKQAVFVVFAYSVLCLITAEVFFFEPNSISPLIRNILYKAFPHWVWGISWAIGGLFGLMFMLRRSFIFFLIANLSFVFSCTSFTLVLLAERVFENAPISYIAITQWVMTTIIPALLLTGKFSVEKRNN